MAQTTTGRRPGRPSSYKPEYADQAAKLCRLGATDEQIAWFFGVGLDELALWAWSNKEFFDAITPSPETRREWAASDRLHKERRAAAKRKRLRMNPSERVANAMRARMWAAVRGKTSGKCLARLGFTLDELKSHLEARFSDGMTWANYGRWHIDHIKPCAAFDQADAEQFSQCWSLDNLQPLWMADNVKKGAKYAEVGEDRSG